MKTRITLIILLLVCGEAVQGQTPRKNNLPLPKIKSWQYLSVPCSFATNYPQTACLDSLYTYSKSYTRRLNSIGRYDLYLLTPTRQEISKTSCFRYEVVDSLSFLVAVDTKSKQARALLVAYEFLSDSEVHLMNFKIKKNQIILTEEAYTEGEGRAEQFIKKKHSITISQKGAFKVGSL